MYLKTMALDMILEYKTANVKPFVKILVIRRVRCWGRPATSIKNKNKSVEVECILYCSSLELPGLFVDEAGSIVRELQHVVML